MKKKAKFIAFDTETGGLNPKINPILTAYFCTLDDEYNVLDELSLKIKPEAPCDQCEAKAMEVNGIDLAKHIESTDCLSRAEATKQLLQFLKKNHNLRPLGQNIDFDLEMIREQLLDGQPWGDHFNYNKYDIKPISNFLKDAGVLPNEIGTLESMAKHFNTQKRAFHDAKADVLTTIEVYTKLVAMVRQMVSQNTAPTFDLLELLEK